MHTPPGHTDIKITDQFFVVATFGTHISQIQPFLKLFGGKLEREGGARIVEFLYSSSDSKK